MLLRRHREVAGLLAAVLIAALGRASHAQANTADVTFMQGMIAHHAQAIAMADLISARTTRREIGLLGQRITVSQKDEIALMRHWLEAHHEKVPALGEGEHEHHAAMAMPADTLMPGMLTADQMATLSAAKGGDFDRLFLRGMIQHHGGALQMVARLFASPGAAQDPEVFRFASDVDADQRAEIARMQRLLDDLQPEARRP